MTIKSSLKTILSNTDIGRKLLFLRRVKGKYSQDTTFKGKVRYVAKYWGKTRVYAGESDGDAIAKMIKNLRVRNENYGIFYYALEPLTTWFFSKPLIENTTVNYSLLVNGSLAELRQQIHLEEQNKIIDAIKKYVERIIKYGEQLETEKGNAIAVCFDNLKNKKAGSFFEALQRILFVNQLIWQTQHKLNGLGNLDFLLYPYYRADIKKGILTKKDAEVLIREFLQVLHQYYHFKSAALLGDTGQIILLGGSDEAGNYQANELTEIFLDVIGSLGLPDPKCLLKVSNKTPAVLLEKAISCIATGIGNPLLANDEIIIPQLKRFGYSEQDACQYGVAACWEPLIPGKSFDQNNVGQINYCLPLIQTLNDDGVYEDFNEFLQAFYTHLQSHVNEVISNVDAIQFQHDPFMSLFVSDCNQDKEDISEGGASYNNLGILSVGMGNAINGLLNIQKYVFKEKRYSLTELQDALQTNFASAEVMLEVLQSNPEKFGKDLPNVLTLVRNIVDKTNSCFEGRKNHLGGKFKFGLSSPAYLMIGQNFGATPDGRKAGEAFFTHISCSETVPYTELVEFASHLDYSGHRFNGNVVDFMVSPDLIQTNIKKFTLFIRACIKQGFFEMQMNVVSSATLIAAKAHPEDFPRLIVRVWGFSAYFNDLPEEYKDVLIQRAIAAEKAA